MLPKISNSLSNTWSDPSRLRSILLTANVPQSFITILYTVPNPPDPTTSSSSRDSSFSMISHEGYGKSPWKVISFVPVQKSKENLAMIKMEQKYIYIRRNAYIWESRKFCSLASLSTCFLTSVYFLAVLSFFDSNQTQKKARSTRSARLIVDIAPISTPLM